MGLKLVITERPSVAQSIVKVIDTDNKKDGYLEDSGYLVNWCSGHLIELAALDAYDPKYQKRKKEGLSVLPEPFRYEVMESTKEQFRKLQELMEWGDVMSPVEMTGVGREGELILRPIYHKVGCKKLFERSWISSMEDKVIEEGFRNLRPPFEYDAFYETALCRERAGWIVGISATRLLSCLCGQASNMGCVMTPTPAMLVKRQEKIDTFKSESFYLIRIKVSGVVAEGRKCRDKAGAENVLQAARNSEKTEVESLQKTEKSEKPPLLYDLTTFRRETSRRYGFTAQQTLDYTQSLYEKKLITYPRTDNRHLTDEMEDSAEILVCQMKEKYGFIGIVYLNSSQVINSKKVSDHHVIISTGNAASVDPSQVPYKEQRVLGLVTAELLSTLGRSCLSEEYHLTLRHTREESIVFTKKVTDPGWHEIQGWILGKGRIRKDDCSSDVFGEDTPLGNAPDKNRSSETASGMGFAAVLATDPSLFAERCEIIAQGPEIRTGRTQPKRLYTEDTLFSVME